MQNLCQHVSVTLGQRSSNDLNYANFFVQIWPIYDVICEQHYYGAECAAPAVWLSLLMYFWGSNACVNADTATYISSCTGSTGVQEGRVRESTEI